MAIGWRVGFLAFLLLAAWQDFKKRSISLGLFLAAGGVGIVLAVVAAILGATAGGAPGDLSLSIAVGSLSWRAAAALLADRAAAAALGGGLLILAASSRGAVGEGDGLFFLVSGLYLGFWRNLLLLFGSLFLCFPVGCVLLLRALAAGRDPRGIRLPFLPFVLPVGIGVILW